jgi:SEC-C motif-containing protein
MPCPCGRPAELASCCGPFLAGAPPATAEQLMRARYTAYVTGAVDFIVATQHAPEGKEVDRDAIERWSRTADWLGLEVVAVQAGGPSDDEGVVEFVARWREGADERRHHERSRFARLDGRWLYLDGRAVPERRAAAPGRNDPCPCGSGKKYNRCHGSR